MNCARIVGFLVPLFLFSAAPGWAGDDDVPPCHLRASSHYAQRTKELMRAGRMAHEMWFWDSLARNGQLDVARRAAERMNETYAAYLGVFLDEWQERPDLQDVWDRMVGHIDEGKPDKALAAAADLELDASFAALRVRQLRTVAHLRMNNVAQAQKEFASLVRAVHAAKLAGSPRWFTDVLADGNLKRDLDALLAVLEAVKPVFDEHGGRGLYVYCLRILSGLAGPQKRPLFALKAAAAAVEAADDPQSRAAASSDVALRYQGLHDYNKARKMFEGLELAAGKSWHLSASIAACLDSVGSFEQALARYDEAFRLYDELPPDEQDSTYRVSLLSNLGNTHLSLGNYAQCLRVHRQSHELAISGPNASHMRLESRRGLLGQAWVYMVLGDHERALDLAHQARSIEVKVLGQPQTSSLRLLTSLHYDQRDWEAYSQVVVELEAAADREQDRKTAHMARLCLATVHEVRGHRDKAYALRLTLLEEAKQADWPEEMVSVGALLAKDEIALGKLSKAQARLKRLLSKASLTSVVGPLHWVMAAMLDLQVRRRAFGVATDLAVETLSSLRRNLSTIHYSASVGARARHQELFEAAIAAARGLGKPATTFRILEATRAGALMAAVNARTTLRARSVPAKLAEAERDAAAELLAANEMREQAQLDGNRKVVRAARRRWDKAKVALRRAADDVAEQRTVATTLLYGEPIDLRLVQKALPSDEALVLFSLPSEYEPRAGALVVTPTKARWVDLGPTKELEATLETLVLDDADRPFEDALAAVRKAVVAPLRLRGVRRVQIVPDGALWTCPFAALMPDMVLVNVPSASLGAALTRTAPKQRGKNVFAVGDPAYGERAGEGAARIHQHRSLAPLPGTRQEVQAIGDTILVGDQATETGVLEALGRSKHWRAVHFACHGLVDSKRPLFSSLAVTPTQSEDGFLTALEIYRSSIPSDLVVLSACETGRGTLLPGEGLLGLTTAFFVAGTPRIIASLWKVDDAATRDLMIKFHQLWNPKDGSIGLPAEVALQQAQAHIRAQAQWAHPMYWAAWALWGAGESVAK